MSENKTTIGDVLTVCLADLKRAGISDLMTLSSSEQEEMFQLASLRTGSSVPPLGPELSGQSAQSGQSELSGQSTQSGQSVQSGQLMQSGLGGAGKAQSTVETSSVFKAPPIIVGQANKILNASSAIDGNQAMARSREDKKNIQAAKQTASAVSSDRERSASDKIPAKGSALGKEESNPKGGAVVGTIPAGVIPVGAEVVTNNADTGTDFSGKIDHAAVLHELAMAVSKCNLCRDLAANRTRTVFGSGNPNAELVFLGEGPGADEDRQGLPFVGRCGQLLTDIITKGMKIRREDVFICNVVRCRPPGNRVPLPDEAANCRRFLDATLQVLAPKYICCLGATAAVNLLDIVQPIGKFRGRVYDYKGAKVICTYHPAYLLRCPAAKAQTWEDIKILMRMMGLPVQG